MISFLCLLAKRISTGLFCKISAGTSDEDGTESFCLKEVETLCVGWMQRRRSAGRRPSSERGTE